MSVWGVPVSSLYQHVHRFYRREKEHILLEYSQRIKLLALFKQVKLGSYTAEKDETGYFDVVGADRRKAWQALGETSREEAQREIVRLLEGVCPQLKEAVLNEYNAAGKQQVEEKRHVGSPEVSRQQAANGREEAHLDSGGSSPLSTVSAPPALTGPAKQEHHVAVLAPAALWCTPRAARNFITQLQSTPSSLPANMPLVLSPGETVSVQVPTSTHASAIFWEFATNSGDIGFGLGFEWGEGEGQVHQYSERLLPVTLRECSDDLVLGSHQYQYQGVYTLNFVNSHSTLPKTVYYKVLYQNTIS